MMLSSKHFGNVLFFLSNLVTGPNFISISSPEIRKSKFLPFSRDCVELEILNLARMFLIKCY